MPFSDHVFLSDLEKFDSFAFKFLSKREVVIQDCEYTGIVFSDRAKSIFFDELSQDESSDLYLNTKISAHYIKRSLMITPKLSRQCSLLSTIKEFKT